MEANILNRIGLILGLVSGLLLIPEVLSLVPIESIEKTLTTLIERVQMWMKLPLAFHPLSWKLLYTNEQREKVLEPITALRTFVFSIVWISAVIFGTYLHSLFFILLGLIMPVYVILQWAIVYLANPDQFGRLNFAVVLGIAIFLIMLVSPIASVIRLLFLLGRLLTNAVRKVFSTHGYLRTALIVLAILAFIVSNLLQILATFY